MEQKKIELIRTNGGFFVSYDGEQKVCTSDNMPKDLGGRLLECANMVAQKTGKTTTKSYFIINCYTEEEYKTLVEHTRKVQHQEQINQREKELVEKYNALVNKYNELKEPSDEPDLQEEKVTPYPPVTESSSDTSPSTSQKTLYSCSSSEETKLRMAYLMLRKNPEGKGSVIFGFGEHDPEQLVFYGDHALFLAEHLNLELGYDGSVPILKVPATRGMQQRIALFDTIIRIVDTNIIKEKYNIFREFITNSLENIEKREAKELEKQQEAQQKKNKGTKGKP